MAGISLLSLLLMQTDRVVLSSLLPLTEFGYYAVAASISTALSSAIGPFFNALYPRYSGLVSAGKSTELSFLYHLSNQLLATIVAPVAMVIAFFSHDILLLWTGNSALAANSAPILSLMAIGTSLNGLVHLPYALQLAYGWTRFALVQNVIAVILFVPAIWWLAHRFGGVGAASAWVALNLGYVLISVPIMHRKLLLGQAGTWYRHDVLPPVIAAAITALIAKLLFPVLHDGFAGFMLLAAIGLATLTASAMSASSFRSWFKQFLCNRLADFR
jgi:O-antigen/teichoic acid export membrane protein